MVRIQKGFIALLSSFILLLPNYSLFAQSYTAPDYVDPIAVFSPSYMLQQPFGARANGMGAFLGQSDDLSAVYYNPAGLRNLDNWELQLSHRDDRDKVDLDSLVTNIPFSFGSLAFYGVIAHVPDYNNTYYGEPANPYKDYFGGFFGLAFGANVFRDIISVGFGSKYYMSKTEDQKISGLLLDFALQYSYDLSRLKKINSIFYYLPTLNVAFTAMNIHPRFESDTDSQDDSESTGYKEFTDDTSSYNVGISLAYTRIFSLNIDFLNPVEGDSEVRLGFELWPIHFLALRSGIGSRYFEKKTYTYYAGFGIGGLLGKNRLSFEYAYEGDFNKFNQSGESRHQISLVNTYGGWQYKPRYRDDRKITLTKLIQSEQGLTVVDQQSWNQDSRDKKDIISVDKASEFRDTGRKWALAVFRYTTISGKATGFEEISSKVTKSITNSALETKTVKLVASWKQEQLADQLKPSWGESEAKFLHRLGTTMGSDFIILGGVRLAGETGMTIQTRVFEVQRKRFVLEVKTTGLQVDIVRAIQDHLKEFQPRFANTVKKKKSAI